MSAISHNDWSLLACTIGPVQSFIATARTTRDLWTGSWLLSHMVEKAIERVRDSGGELIYPVSEGESHLFACLPNLLLAQAPAHKAAEIAKAACEGARGAWKTIADQVRAKLRQQWGSGWDDGWDLQTDNFFDIRWVVLPPDRQRSYKERFIHVGKLLAAGKTLRHVEPPEPDSESRPKCMLTGSHAQMGPRSSHADWWKDTASKQPLCGTRVGETERLCAISLVKRFAWVPSIQPATRAADTSRRFPDTATIAAIPWLTKAGIEWDRVDGWSGQWLQWSENQLHGIDQVPDERAPSNKVADAIIDARGMHGWPPIYYAILMLDGDNMGTLVQRTADDATDPVGRHTELSKTLAGFASVDVPRIIERHHGTLVYSGGDDVLALLPIRSAVPCARELAGQFSQSLVGQTASTGIVFAHYKSDLRIALEECRAAEKQAKNAGKNCLCIRVLKRGGEHASAVLGWSDTEPFLQLEDYFAPTTEYPQGQATDRWAYELERLAPSLAAIGADAVLSQARRLIGRSEKRPDRFEAVAVDFWKRVHGFFEERARSGDGTADERLAESIRQFCFLVRTASFVTRGREEQR
jgi:CRISPR-associated protein Cmr2